MNAKTNTTENKKPRTNKITTTIVISLITLVAGLFIGAAAAETGTGLRTASRTVQPSTEQSATHSPMPAQTKQTG